jgi:hypothetical protein
MEIYLGKTYKRFSHIETDNRTFMDIILAHYSGNNTQPYAHEIISHEVRNGKVKLSTLDILKIFSGVDR